jgi:hypothetical protein
LRAVAVEKEGKERLERRREEGTLEDRRVGGVGVAVVEVW